MSFFMCLYFSQYSGINFAILERKFFSPSFNCILDNILLSLISKSGKLISFGEEYK